MNRNFNPDLIDNDYIRQEDELINPEYAQKAQEEKLKQLQLIEAIKQKQKMNKYPKGTDMYYELRKPNTEPIPDLSDLKDLEIWDLLGD